MPLIAPVTIASGWVQMMFVLRFGPFNIRHRRTTILVCVCSLVVGFIGYGVCVPVQEWGMFLRPPSNVDVIVRIKYAIYDVWYSGSFLGLII